MSKGLVLALVLLASVSEPTATRADVVIPDESGNGLDATFVGSPQFVSECAGQALEVLPTSLDLNHHGSVEATASQVIQELTVEGFFRWSGNTDGASLGRTIIDKVSQGDDAGRSWAIGIITDTRQLTAVVWYNSTNGRIDLVDPDPLPNPMTECVHAALTVSAGGEVRLYRDGQLKAFTSFSGMSVNYASNTPIGFANSINYSSPMRGVLDQFRISNIVRTSFPSSPQALPLDSNTVALWRFGTDCGPPYTVSGQIRDAQGNGIPGVQVNKGCDVGGYTTTDANGYWTIGGISAACCTITPVRAGCTFSPPSQTICGCAEDVDFTCDASSTTACYPLNADPGVFTFLDPNNYLHGAFPVASHTVVDGDGMGFDMKITGCSVPGNFGAESAIGFTTQGNTYSMGVLLVYDDQVCYRARLFANGDQGTDAVLNVGTTYHYAFDYSGGTLSLAITDANGGLVHSDAMAHTPGTGDIFQFGVDYPGGGTEYFQWANGRVEFRVDRAADPSHIEGWVDNLSAPGCDRPTAPACLDLDDADPGVFTFLDPNNYLHGAFPVGSHTVVDGDGMGFDMRITGCSVPGNFGAESAIGFTTQGNTYSMGVLLVYDDQVCYRARLFANGVQGPTDAVLNVGTTYHYAFDYSGGTLSLAITDVNGGLVHSDAMAHTPGTGDIFQFGVDYPGGGTEYFQWANGRVEFRVDRAADPSHIEGWVDNVSAPGCATPACYPLDGTDPSVFTFLDPNNYLHGAFGVASHAVVDGDGMEFAMRITDCSVPGNFGAESAIGFTTQDNTYSMGILLVYDDQVCYRARLFANGNQGTDAVLNVGTTYHYLLEYSGGALSLVITDAGGSLIHTDAMAHAPGMGDIFQCGVDYPGGGTEYFQWANGRVEFRVDRAADPSHIEGWIDNVTTPGCATPACYAFDGGGPIIYSFQDPNNYLHGAFPVTSHTVVDGDDMEFDMKMTDCSVPGNFGAESAIGFTTEAGPYFMGLLLVYDDQTCYRVRLFAGAVQGTDATLNVGTMYHYAFNYSGGTLSLTITDEGGALVHTDAMAHAPGTGNIFQCGVDYPGGGTEYFRVANGRLEFRVDRAADPSHIEGWIDNVSTPGCNVEATSVPAATVSSIPRLLAAPNPLAGTTELSFDLPMAQRVQLAIFDVSGRLVRNVVDETLVAGYHRFQWNGVASSGRRVAAGVYFGRVTTAQGAKSTRLVVLR